MKLLNIRPAQRVKVDRLMLVLMTVFLSLMAGLVAFFLLRQVSQYGMGSLNISSSGIFNTQPDTGDINNNPSSEIVPPDGGEWPIEITNLTPWDGAGRVTILILGLDYRDWQSREKHSRSDTMMLLTLDPLTKTAGMLSIPRDMWVSIPGFKHGKINTAHYLGEAYKLPGGGPGLAVKTVEQFLGVPINYYAVVDFNAFVRFIDEIGGVKINVPEKITIDLIGAGASTKKTLEPGIQVLPGQWALAYARTRSTEGGDFDRAQRQQQVILAIRDRILSFDMLPTLITKAPTLFKELSSGINTNLNLDDALKLALLAQEVSDNNIKRGVLDEDYVLFGFSQDNLSIVIPIPDKIHVLRDEIFTSSGGIRPETPGSPQKQMQIEGASLAIYNASQTTNLANNTAEYLRNLGVNVHQIAEVSEYRASSRIVDHTGNPFLLNYLVDLMEISPSNIFSDFDPTNNVDVEIFLGNDWAVSDKLP